MVVHSFMVCGTRFDIDSKYSLIKPIGQGAYGVVCSALNNETGEKVAIKKVSGAFEHVMDSKRTLRELRLLRHFDHENIIRIREILCPVARDKFEDVYIVSELMDTDLHQIISSPQPLSEDHVQYFLYQVLRGLKYIHAANVLHRDLKPSNLLVNGNCDLKICDFGLARKIASVEETGDAQMTEYVATRWFRAPEIMLSQKEYTSAIDIWSVGCIFAELLGRKPLFPGKDYIHQLNLITDVLGSPAEEDTAFIESVKARRYINALPQKPKVAWEDMYPDAPPEALDLLDRLLQFNPNKRISVFDALAHPYLETLHDESDEPVCDTEFSFDFENGPLSKEYIKDLTWEEVLYYHPGADVEGITDGVERVGLRESRPPLPSEASLY